MNRQTITYLELSRIMYGRDAAGVLDDILGHIAFYCIDNGIPPVTSIVVGKGRGTPGADIPVDPEQIDELREKVYEFDWYDLYPPFESELKAAFDSHR
jgi:hypothetical protein